MVLVLSRYNFYGNTSFCEEFYIFWMCRIIDFLGYFGVRIIMIWVVVGVGGEGIGVGRFGREFWVIVGFLCDFEVFFFEILFFI